MRVEDLAEESGLVVQVDDPLFDRGLVRQLAEPFLLGW
jgi:hypothetical protein